MTHLDGNVLAGPLSEIFREDMTTASGRCSSCGDVSVLAQAMVYDVSPGWCVRCHNCDDVLLVLVWTGSAMRISFRGLSTLGVSTTQP